MFPRHRDDPFLLRLLLRLLDLVARVVPRPLRSDWLREWDAEVRHRWAWLEARRALGWRQKLDLTRRLLGSAADAAWLRRQFTGDADFVHDVRHGLRLLGRNLPFSVAAVAILATGIGANTAVFTIVDRLLLRELPYPESDRIVTLWQTNPPAGIDGEDVSPANFLDWKERSRSFTVMAAADPYSMDYTGGDAPEVFFTALVTEGFFRALGVDAFLGRTLLPEDHQPGRHRVIVVSHAFWKQRFGGDAGIVGRTLQLDGEAWEVVGVLPPDVEPRLLPSSTERGLWAPKVIAEWEPRIRGSAFWNVVARLRHDVTIEQAQSELDAIAATLAREYPRTNANSGVRIVRLRDHLAGAVGDAMVVAGAAVGLVLLIACANVASLLLSRGAERSREFSMRAALGASRGRIVRQMLAESLLLAALACAAGLVLARWGLAAIAALAPAVAAEAARLPLDGRILAFAATLAAVTAFAFGIAPALAFARRSAANLHASRGSGDCSRAAVRRSLVVAEIALAMVITTGAGLLVRGFVNLLGVDPGFTPRNVLALQMFAWDRHATPEQQVAFFDDVLGRIRELPGIETAGLVMAMPFIESNINVESALRIEGRPAPAAGDEPSTFVNIATTGYFEAMRIPVERGRLFTADDRVGTRPVALVNEALARRYWPGTNPVGQRITVQMSGRPWQAEVVGVVGAVRHDGLDGPPRPEAFFPHSQQPSGSMTIVMRGSGDARALLESAKRQVWAVDPLQAFYRTATLDELLSLSTAGRRFSVVLLAALAGVALALSVVGVYALVAFSTRSRAREIGVRMAMGATRSQIVRLVVGETARLVAAGLAFGLVAALGFGRLLQSLLFDVTPGDPLTIAGVAALLAAVTLAASLAPARRATRVDPSAVLRAE